MTPVYNGQRFIEFCIKNVIDQHCSHAEHIIVDGGSTDGTVEIIKSYAEKYPHIRWISEKDNGQSDAMNKGISMAKGEILGVLNVDDFMSWAL
jgi:glycosyltransferase involved in cell wall biosynthesis